MLNSLARKLLSLLRSVNLWPRLAVAVTLGFLLLFAVLAVLILRVVDDSRDRIFQERLVIADLTARQIDGVIGHAFTELEGGGASLSHQPTNSNLTESSARLAEVLDGMDERWMGLYLLDDSGAMIAAAPPFAGGFAADMGDDDGFRQMAAGARRAVSDPYTDAVSGKPATMLMVNLGGSESGTGLTLGGVVDLSHIDFLQPLNDAKSIGDTGHAELVDDTARVVASTDDGEFLAPGEHQQFYLRMQQASTEGVEVVPFEPHGQAGDADNHGDDDHVMAFAQLSNAPWGLAVGGAESETLAPVTDLRNNILLLGAGTLAILWLVTLVGARLLVRPVRVLTGAADKISAGDLDTPIRLMEGGEIGRLGETLEEMRIRLRASLQESARWTEELEKRVRERTRKLESLNRSRAELLGKVISAQEEERKRIARELHDESAQALATLLVELQGMEESLPTSAREARKKLGRVKSQTTAALTDMRQIILDLRPSVLDELGLVAAVRWYARTHLEATRAGVSLDVRGQQKRVPGSVETAMFRIAQEALNNVAKHAEPKNVKVRFEFTDDRVSLLVEDDGRGFDVEAVTRAEDGTARLGLAGMTERATLLGGKAAIESDPGRGTRVSVEIPTERDMD